MLYFEPLLKDCLRRHVCDLVNCVACELRWVFDMLDLAQAEPREVVYCAGYRTRSPAKVTSALV